MPDEPYDPQVLSAQRFFNDTYSNIVGMTLVEDGRTGWQTVYGLTRALQHELGITAYSDSFGPATLAALQDQYPRLNRETVPSSNVTAIIQSALFCKGYHAGGVDGVFGDMTEGALTDLKADMGLASADPGGDLTPKVFKGLLTMDPYVLVDGSSEVRAAQQWMNARYLDRRDYYISPCDGRNSRAVSKAMIFAVQYELGMADGVANGNFGNATKAGLRDTAHHPGSGWLGVWVELFSAAMALNQVPQATFGPYFSAGLATATASYQQFRKLEATGRANFETWASLLVSYGDQGRSGAGIDASSTITSARAQTLIANGITHVGRYIVAVSRTSEKLLRPSELQVISDSGLRLFPIFQLYGRNAAEFTYTSGRSDGQHAVNAALDHGLRPGTLVYFAIDFDALDAEVTEHVIPYFKGVHDAIQDDGGRYQVGIYGPRNVCSRTAEAGYSRASFVSNMSSGFSANLGYPMPADWSFDQFVTKTFGVGDGAINVDVDVVSGRDSGQGEFDSPRPSLPDVRLRADLWEPLSIDVNRYMESIGEAADGGDRPKSHAEAFATCVTNHDGAITDYSVRYSMRKAMIQATAYLEMRHVSDEDLLADDYVRVRWDSGLGFEDHSTGIAQIFGASGMAVWRWAVTHGRESELLDTDGAPIDITDESEGALYRVWTRLRESWHDEDEVPFSLATVGLHHMFKADELGLREISFDYSVEEIRSVLLAYQGTPDNPGAQAGTRIRMGLYQIFEKYNSIARNP